MAVERPKCTCAVQVKRARFWARVKTRDRFSVRLKVKATDRFRVKARDRFMIRFRDRVRFRVRII